MTTTLPSRQLGLWEATCKFAHDVYAGTSIVVAHANLIGQLEPHKIRDTFQQLFNRHPLLRATIVERHRDAYFILNANFVEIPIALYDYEDEQQWQQLVEQELLKKFDLQKNLWRVIILIDKQTKNHRMIIALHHAIADGLSAYQIIKQFCEAYDSHQQNQQDHYELPKSVEACLVQTTSWGALLTQKAKTQNFIEEVWFYDEVVKLTERRMRNIYRSLLSEQLQRLKLACQQNSVTINSALNAAALCASAQLSNKKYPLTLHTPINLRSHCNPAIANEAVGCFISMVTTEHRLNKPLFWQEAKDYQIKLKQQIPSTGFCPADFSLENFDIAEIRLLFDAPGSTKRKSYSSGFGITNLGVLPQVSSSSKINLRQFMFCTNHVMGEFIIFINVVTLCEQLDICFSFAEPLLHESKALQWIDLFMKYLNIM